MAYFREQSHRKMPTTYLLGNRLQSLPVRQRTPVCIFRGAGEPHRHAPPAGKLLSAARPAHARPWGPRCRPEPGRSSPGRRTGAQHPADLHRLPQCGQLMRPGKLQAEGALCSVHLPVTWRLCGHVFTLNPRMASPLTHHGLPEVHVQLDSLPRRTLSGGRELIPAPVRPSTGLGPNARRAGSGPGGRERRRLDTSEGKMVWMQQACVALRGHSATPATLSLLRTC